MFGPLGNEFRWAARRLLSTRASTLAALAVLTLGIGAVVTIYTVDRAVLLADLPLPRASQLVVVFRRVGSEVGPRQAPADLIDLRRQRDVFSSVSAKVDYRALMTGSREPAYVQATSVTADFFRTLGASPILGHVFLSADDLTGAVLSWTQWQNQFGGDTGVIGRPLMLDGKPYRVLGVMPKGLDFFGTDVWLPGPGGFPKSPLPVGPDLLVRRDVAYLEVVGRLRNGLDPRSARPGIDRISRIIAANYPPGLPPVSFSIRGLKETIVGDASSQLTLLSSGALLTFLLVFHSVSGLIVGRSMRRYHE